MEPVHTSYFKMLIFVEQSSYNNYNHLKESINGSALSTIWWIAEDLLLCWSSPLFKIYWYFKKFNNGINYDLCLKVKMTHS